MCSSVSVLFLLDFSTTAVVYPTLLFSACSLSLLAVQMFLWKSCVSFLFWGHHAKLLHFDEDCLRKVISGGAAAAGRVTSAEQNSTFNQI